MKLARAALLTGAIVALASGCATVRYPDVYPTVERAIVEGEQDGLALDNPFALDDEIRAEVDEAIGLRGTPYERVRRIVRFLMDRGYLGFEYEEQVTLTARDAYRSHKGNCMAYTSLLLSVARHLRINAFFVLVNEARSFYERDGSFVMSSHMAVGYEAGPRITVVDFSGESDNLRLYHRVDDLEAFCLFHNNRAVDLMFQGDIDGAETLLKFLIRQKPGLAATRNNLGVLYLRQAKYPDALKVFKELVADSPDYRPTITNGLVAARGARDEILAREFEAAAARLAETDPFYLFNEGVKSFQEGSYNAAAASFQKALRIQPRNPLLLCWLAKVHLKTGKNDEAARAFRKAREISPNHKVVLEMLEKYPTLAPPGQ